MPTDRFTTASIRLQGSPYAVLRALNDLADRQELVITGIPDIDWESVSIKGLAQPDDTNSALWRAGIGSIAELLAKTEADIHRILPNHRDDVELIKQVRRIGLEFTDADSSTAPRSVPPCRAA